MYDEESGMKVMTVEKLRELLSTLDPTLIVYPNRVMNLGLSNPAMTTLMGYIDFLEETVNLAHEKDTND